MRTKLGRLAGGFAILLAICVLVVLGATLQFAHGNRICKGVSVSGIDLGGLNKYEASAKVQAWAIARAHRSMTLTAMDRRWAGTPASLGIRVDWQSAVHKAFLVGRQGPWLNSVLCILTRTGEGKTIVPELLVDRNRLRRTLRKVARVVNVSHTDARMHVIDSQITITQDSCGLRLDEKAAENVVFKAAALGQNVAHLLVLSDPPDVTARDAGGIDTRLASFTTSFNPGKRGRTHNLTLAARSINGVLIKPGQIFSYNDHVGPRLETRGFQMAQVYVKGKLEDGIGGGVCQVSSTLYNAALLAGLKIRERSPHCQVVPYVSPGRDATVAYGHRDFRFENSGSGTIGITSSVHGAHLTIDIYGAASDKKQVKVYVGSIRRIGAGNKTVSDGTLTEGARRLVEKGADGCVAVVYRSITEPDGKKSVETIRSKYAPQKAVVAVGATAKASAD